MKGKNFDKFFKQYSKNVDSADSSFFWKLSDDIIEKVIQKHIPKILNNKKTILDAGGGTGRWIIKLSKIYKCNFILFDLSEDMIRQAKKNIKVAKIEKRVQIISGDLESIKKIGSSSIDYIISIYNPISFVFNQKRAIKEMYRILKTNGILLIMGQGFHNAICSKINNSFASPLELDTINKRENVKWNRDVPRLKIFTMESLSKLVEKAKFKIVDSYGIPVFVRPGAEDFDSLNNLRSMISKELEKNGKFYKKVLKLEMNYNNDSSVVNRGMNILLACKK